MNLTLASLNIFSIVPIIITLLGALGILVLDLIIPRFYRGIFVSLSAIILALSLASVIFMEGGESGFFGFIIMDRFALVAQIIILTTSILFIFLSLSKNSYREFECAEFYALFLFMIAGYQFMVSSANSNCHIFRIRGEFFGTLRAYCFKQK